MAKNHIKIMHNNQKKSNYLDKYVAIDYNLFIILILKG